MSAIPSLRPACAVADRDCLLARLRAARDWPLAEDRVPAWLRPEQERPFRRGVAGVRRHGGFLLATPVGSGKTYLALAIARCWQEDGPIDVVVPAVLRSQWQRVAEALGLSIRITSHEWLSRHALPSGGSGPVIVDECHRFRGADTRRYRSLARSLVGRVAVLATATPIVNRSEDLVNQLLLVLPDDALLLYGIASLRALVTTRVLPRALGAVMTCRAILVADTPSRRSSTVPDWSAGDPMFRRIVRTLDRLTLSQDRSIAALIRGSLLRALASSPAALLGSVARYRGLLGHASAAKDAGHPINRAAIRAAVLVDPDQLVLWELLDKPEAPADLALGDLPRLATLERHTRGWATGDDPKLALLRALLDPTRPTAVFTTSVDTLDYLRRRLGVGGVAWVAGSRAGIGPIRATRAAVLDSFDPAGAGSGVVRPPWLLLTTDVSAEGLNLQRLGKVIHYDLPWTPARLGQREGRVARPGSTRAEVDVVRFATPADLERRVAIEALLDRKAGLSTRLSSIDEPSTRSNTGPASDASGWCLVRSLEPGGLALVSLTRAGSEAVWLVLGRIGDGEWTDEPAVVDALLTTAAGGVVVSPTAMAVAIVRSLDETLAARVRGLGAGVFQRDRTTMAAVGAIQLESERAARTRNTSLLAQADAVLRFLARGHRAGETMLAEEVRRGDATAVQRAARLGASVGASGLMSSQVVAMIAFVGNGSTEDATTAAPLDDRGHISFARVFSAHSDGERSDDAVAVGPSGGDQPARRGVRR